MNAHPYPNAPRAPRADAHWLALRHAIYAELTEEREWIAGVVAAAEVALACGPLALSIVGPNEPPPVAGSACAVVVRLDTDGLLMLHSRDGGAPAHLHAARAQLVLAGLQLETGFRLRRGPELQLAVLDPDGRVIDSSLACEGEDDVLTLLIHGQLALVPRGTEALRRYLVVETQASTRALRALTATEAEILRHASRGLPSKLVAYTLGLSPSKVSARLASAAAKMGATSPRELTRVAALLTRGPACEDAGTLLTQAERHVLALLRRGLSNSEIARARERSVRTVANQVASLLRKTTCSSRRALFGQAVS